MPHFPRFLSILSILVLTAALSGCMHAGIIVVPTVPSLTPPAATESTISAATQATSPAATTVPQDALPTEHALPPPTVSPTEPTEAPVTEPTEPSLPQETLPTEPTLPPVTESTNPTTPPTEPTTAPVTEPTESSLPQETTSPAETAPTEAIPETTEAGTNSARHDPYDVASYSISLAEQALLDQIHAMRARKQLPALVTDTKLCALAYLRAYETMTQFSHVRPNGSDYTTVFGEYNYFYTASGENILKSEDWYPADYILEDWLFTKVTADNLTAPGFTHLGVGIYEKNGYIYVACLLTAK